MSNSQSRFWRWCGIIAVVVICTVIAFVAWLEHTLGEPRRIRDQIGDTIASLAKKCPPDMTQGEWNVAVSWTGNLPGNTLLPGWADLDDMRRFQRELEERAKGKVDMDLIIWIWDQVAKISPNGLRYKYRFQNVMFEDMQPNRTFGYYWDADDPLFRVRHDLISQIDATVRSLATKCPPDLTQDQWHIAISRTNKLPRNPSLTGRVELDDLRRFQRELDEKARGKVDMELILWIWDEYAKLSSAAQEYKQKFQRAMLDDMQSSSAKRPIRSGDIGSDEGDSGEGNTVENRGTSESQRKGISDE